MLKILATLLLLFSLFIITNKLSGNYQSVSGKRLLEVIKPLVIIYTFVWLLVRSYFIETENIIVSIDTIYSYLSLSLFGCGVVGIFIYYTGRDQYIPNFYKVLAPYVEMGMYFFLILFITSYFIIPDSILGRYSSTINIAMLLLMFISKWLNRKLSRLMKEETYDYYASNR